ncbi:glycosyltransferase [Porphyromonas sp. COT-239 OH1446]|uniref:glycosyltransferase n=1 Tax=Porphyromonas sp. COT-239 OH1446 TaxID=1515613 RepID=UPI00068A8B8D|nr:glycosyltransferase [Porphyromonas sp. COT-239 OH1446]
MKVLLITTSLTSGGAAIACRRNYEALSRYGVDVRVLVLHELDNLSREMQRRVEALSSRRGSLSRSWWYNRLERLEILLRNGRSCRNLFRFSSARWGYDPSRHEWASWADVIHLHWVNHGMLRLGALEGLRELGKPVFWTMHDLWPVLGGCHLPFVWQERESLLCTRISEGCGYCPLLSSRRKNDLSQYVASRKRRASLRGFHLIAVSQAEASLASAGCLSQGFSKPEVLPNPLNLSCFCPGEVDETRTFEGYCPSRKYILVAAARLDDRGKGAVLLREMLEHFAFQAASLAEQTTLLLVGQERDAKILAALPIDAKHLGSISQEEDLINLYRLSHVVISTSLYETFGQSLSEALACGTPVLSFAGHGAEDLVRPGENGFLSRPYDARQMASQLVQLLTSEDEYLPKVCHSSVEWLDYSRFAPDLLKLYHASLEDRTPVSI